MGYTPAEGVPALDYDFNPFVDVKGQTPEPSDKQMGDYWKGYGRLIRENQRGTEGWLRKLQVAQAAVEASESLDQKAKDKAQKALDAVGAEYDAWSEQNGDATRSRRKDLLAEVCSGQPSREDLDRLPGRVYDDFESYMQEELTPKGRRSASS